MLTPDQRRWRADKIGDLANIAVGALLFGQLTASTFRFGLAIASVIILVLLYAYSDFLLKKIHHP